MTPPAFFCGPAFVLAVLLASCTDAPRVDSPVDTFTAKTEARAGVPLAKEGAVVTLVAPTLASPGTPVPLRVQVRNETAAPLDLYLRGREVTFDILVSDASGDAVWSRLSGQVTQAILQLRTLAPGEVMEMTHTWDQKSQRGAQVQPGTYKIRGMIITDGQSRLESAPVTIEITPNS